MKIKDKRQNVVIGIVLVFVVVGLLGYNNFASLLFGGSSSKRTTREVALSCTTDMFTKYHIHPFLKIIVSGVEQEIPANTGVTLTCMHPLHTHDTTGKIHVESPEQRDFTLADFFAVWERAFSKDQILDQKVDADHGIIMTVNGVKSDQYENLELRDADNIVIEYKQKSK